MSTHIPIPTHKRTRTPPNLSSPPEQPTPKALRTATLPSTGSTATTTTTTTSSSQRHLICTLPPTCNRAPTSLGSTQELERHYATYHAHVCEVRGCGCVFPDARLLELHQTECHDPIAAVRKDRGEKIFACHLASCPKVFQTPKGRRLHLIEGHGYPKEYFFAVTNKGVGGLLKKWGEGVSLVRGPWKARDRKDATGEDEDEEEDGSEDEERGEGDGVVGHGPLVEEDDDEGIAEGEEGDETVDEIADAMSTMALVPPAIRFGRGAKRGGFRHGEEIETRGRGRGRGRGSRGRDSRGRGGGGNGAGAGAGAGGGSQGGEHVAVAARGLGGGRGGRSGFPRGGRVIGRLVAARGGR